MSEMVLYCATMDARPTNCLGQQGAHIIMHKNTSPHILSLHSVLAIDCECVVHLASSKLQCAIFSTVENRRFLQVGSVILRVIFLLCTLKDCCEFHVKLASKAFEICNTIPEFTFFLHESQLEFQRTIRADPSSLGVPSHNFKESIREWRRSMKSQILSWCSCGEFARDMGHERCMFTHVLIKATIQNGIPDTNQRCVSRAAQIPSTHSYLSSSGGVSKAVCARIIVNELCFAKHVEQAYI
mmetsp:Transcript_4309/g.16236  ORF Transcript_4309/g.16236 Transcript_4309/m.16236 type:complete len:241 (+) Transcript_4309:2584-3306(+)